MAVTPPVEICIVGTLSVLALAAGIRLSHHAQRLRPYLLAASLFTAIGYSWAFSGRLGWTAPMPKATLVFWLNLMPVMLSFTAGLAFRSQRISGWRRPIAIGMLNILAMSYIVTPLIRPTFAPLPLDRGARWDGEICLQSHPSSCAPAAAATLLHLNGIRATERSMARVCYTSLHGTEPLGLFRGLVVASECTAATPTVASANSDRWQELNQLPNVALVRFTTAGEVRPLHRLLGPRGEGHAVVVLGKTADNRWRIADPAFGNTLWTDSEFRERFTGDAIYLSRR